MAGFVGRAYHLLPMFYYARPAIPFSLLAEFYMRQRSSQPAEIGANRPKTIVAAVSATTRRHSLAVPSPRAYAVRWPRGGVRHGAQRAAQAPIPALVESFGSCLTSFRAKLRPGSALEASLRGYRRPSYRGREVVTVAGVVGRAYHLLLFISLPPHTSPLHTPHYLITSLAYYLSPPPLIPASHLSHPTSHFVTSHLSIHNYLKVTSALLGWWYRRGDARIFGA